MCIAIQNVINILDLFYLCPRLLGGGVLTCFSSCRHASGADIFCTLI